MTRWQVAKHVAWQIVGDDVVIVDLRSGNTIALNGTGSCIWKTIASGDDVETSLRRSFASEGDLRADIEEFTSMLRQRGLIVSAGEACPDAQ